MTNSNGTTGNRNRDLPVFSAVPQPTASPWSHQVISSNNFVNAKYGSETGFRTLKEHHKLQEFENKFQEDDWR
jgi:hypothetical protein